MLWTAGSIYQKLRDSLAKIQGRWVRLCGTAGGYTQKRQLFADQVVIRVVCHAATGGGRGLVQGGVPADMVVDRLWWTPSTIRGGPKG